MSERPAPTDRGLRRLLLVWGVCATALLGFGAVTAQAPGLYYDEAFLAQQARDFLEPERAPDHATSVRSVELWGRPFPLRNAVYLGSLKSQLAIPALALFGARPVVVRLNTLAWSLLALLFTALFARRAFGASVAGIALVLLALDPAYVFFSLYEWGPFTTGFLCRALALWLALRAWQEESVAAALGAGLAVGLGVYNRADFAVIPLVLGAAWLALDPASCRRLVGERRRLALAALAGALLGAAPMWLTAADLFATSGSGALAARGDWGEKLRVAGSLLDGSRFYRVLASGGVFARMFEVSAPGGPFGWAVLGAAAVVLLRARRSMVSREGGGDARAGLWLLAGTVGVTAATAALPGAVRAHHLLNALPLPHLVVAWAAVHAWRARPRWRVGLALFALVLAAGQLRVLHATRSLAVATGGRGWWSDALMLFAREIDAPGQAVVSLDWGLHEPVLFATRSTRAEQPIWRIGGRARQAGEWTRDGSAGDVYLLHAPAFELFGFSPLFEAAVREAQARGVAIAWRWHASREGEPVFASARIEAAHRLSYQRGRFRIDSARSP